MGIKHLSVRFAENGFPARPSALGGEGAEARGSLAGPRGIASGDPPADGRSVRRGSPGESFDRA